MDQNRNELIAEKWIECGGTVKDFNESWQFIEAFIGEIEKKRDNDLHNNVMDDRDYEKYGF